MYEITFPPQHLQLFSLAHAMTNCAALLTTCLLYRECLFFLVSPLLRNCGQVVRTEGRTGYVLCWSDQEAPSLE